MAGQANAAEPPREVLQCAWAKVNLYLHVVGKRDDGYHLLDSLIVFAGIGDRLQIAQNSKIELQVGGPQAAAVPADEGNLVLRAARALARLCEIQHGARIRLDKQLPVAAGVGGGSSDAAAVLEALSRLWGVVPDGHALLQLAEALGADVPACLFGRPAFIGGIGGEIARAPPLPHAWLVLANPNLPLATPEVFKARSGDFSEPARWSELDTDATALAQRLQERRNDLEPAALGLCPEIGAVLAALRALPGCLLARMSGSGATCFALFADHLGAQSAAGAFAEAHPAWWVAAAPLLHGKLERAWWGPPDAA